MKISTPRICNRSSARINWKCVATVLITFCCSTSILTQAIAEILQDPPTLSPEQTSDLKLFSESLRNASIASESRIQAARNLLKMRIPQAIEVLNQSISSEDQQLAGIVITALTTVQEAPSELLEGLIGVLKKASKEQAREVGAILSRYQVAGVERLTQAALNTDNEPALRLGAVNALGELRSSTTVRQSVDALIQIIQPNRNEASKILVAAYESLERLTNRSRVGRIARDWTAWWSRTRILPVEDWLPDEIERLNLLVESQQKQISEKSAEIDVLKAKLSAIMADAYFALKTESIDKVQVKLTEWVRDDTQAVREIALSRLDAVIVNNEFQLSAELQTAIAERLSDTYPGIRRFSAQMLVRIRYAGVADLIADKLTAETDAGTIVAFLDILASNPSQKAIVRIIELLNDEATRDAAARAALEAARQSMVTGDEMSQLQATARTVYNASASPSTIDLLAAVGTPEDITTLIVLLNSENAATRSTAAKALRSRSEAQTAILEKSNDPAIQPTAINILADGEATTVQFGRLLKLAVTDDEIRKQWRGAILKLADRLQLTDLPACDRILEDLPADKLSSSEKLAMQEAVLARVMTTPPDSMDAELRVNILFRLAQLRFALNRPEGTLDSLERIINGNGGSPEQSALRFKCLIQLARFKEAFDVDSNIANWLTEFALLVDSDPKSANPLKDAIAEYFPNIEGAQKQQFITLVAKISDEEDNTEKDGQDSGSDQNRP